MRTATRSALAVVFSAVFALVTSPAHAGGASRIDHIEPREDGSVRLLVSIPGLPTGVTPDLGTVRVDVSGRKVSASASPVEAGDIKRTAVLALDVSNSMAGERFAAAKAAALGYVERVPGDVAVGLVTFAGSVQRVQAPTTDHDALAAALARMHLSSGTRLYDGALRALDVAGSAGQRNILLLSDGADTSATSLETVIATAKRSGVVVDAVAVQQSQANQSKLRSITAVTGGAVVPADDPKALTSLLAQEADTLSRQVLVTIPPTSGLAGENALTVSVEAGGQVYTDSAFVRLSPPDEPSAEPRGLAPVEVESTVVDARYLYIGLAAFGLGLAVILGALFLGKSGKRKTLAERQIEFFSGAQPAKASSASLAPGSQMRDSAVRLAEQVVKSGGLELKLSQRLSSAGMAFTAAEWLLLHAGIALLSGLFGLVLAGPAAMVLLGLLGLVLPWVYLGFKRGRRLGAFNAQLAETLQLISGGLAAGLSMPQAVDTVVREGTEPMAGELRRALVEQRLGVEIEDALEGVADRMTSEDFRWVIMAIRIQREVGGNLAELLNTVAGTLREREYLRRQVKVLSAEGRMSAWIIGALPVVFVLYLTLTKPGYLTPMYTTGLGIALSAAGTLMLIAGAFVLSKITKVEV